jgi:hypothetical protein
MVTRSSVGLFMGAAALALAAGSAGAQVYSASPNIPIPNSPTVQNTIHIDGGPASITSVHLILKVRHTYDSDLDIALVRGGSYLRLTSRNGFDGHDYFTTRFRDDTTDYIFDGHPPFNGDFRPEGGVLTPASTATIPLPPNALPSFTALNGQSAGGDWTLWIDDTVDFDTGTLVYWSLEFNGAQDPNGPFGGNPPPPPPPTYTETGDAGDLPTTAQVCAGSGPVSRIVGGLSTGDVDMYAINICDVTAFSATTVGGSYVDTQLFLFDALGRGVTHNDEDPSGLYSQSTITGAFVPGPGVYYLAISEYDRDPVDSQERLLWLNEPFDTERAPDGAGAANPVDHWVGADNGGSYRIFLSGACFAGPRCETADFDCDGDTGTDLDIEAFFACVAGNCPAPPCNNTGDFDGDGDVATDADIEAFFRVLAGATC